MNREAPATGTPSSPIGLASSLSPHPSGPNCDPAVDPSPAQAFGCARALRRDSDLERSLALAAADPRLRVGAFILDPARGRYASVDGDNAFAAASTIKIPIAVQLLRLVDRGGVSLEEKLVMRLEDIAGGSGHLQYLKPGLSLSLKRTAELMISRSDNTATNMLIARLGGVEAVNSGFEELGLPQTRIENLLPDMSGTNRTSPRDLASLLSRLTSGDLLTAGCRGILFGWMNRSHVKSLLPAGLGRGARCYNKSGDIPSALADAGVVLLPGGRCYIAAVQVERPRNSRRANEIIRRLSRAAYARLS